MSHPVPGKTVAPTGWFLFSLLLALPWACSGGDAKPHSSPDGAREDAPNLGTGGTSRADGPGATGGALSTPEAGAGGLATGGVPGGGGQVGSDASLATGGISGTGGLSPLDGGTAAGGGPGSGGQAGSDASIATGGASGSGGSIDGGGAGVGSGGAAEVGGAGGGGGGSQGGATGSGGSSVLSICGDQIVSGNENCDDGNARPFDGCSTDCRQEPACSASGPCTSVCGDGLVIGEDCDDGNTLDGDGCSAGCTIEPGWTCTQPPLPDKLLMPAVYRDFRFQKPSDFEAGVTGSYDPTTGIVNLNLDGEGKPVYSGATGGSVHIESTATFATWYRNTEGVNHPSYGSLALWSNGDGTYANRSGANGERWQVTDTAYFCGTVGNEIDGQPCTYQVAIDGGISYPATECQSMEEKGYTQLECINDAGTYQASYVVAEVNGNPLFFPVDDDVFTPASEKQGAQIPSEPANLYDATRTWPWDRDDAGDKRPHNFSFTSEMRFWFKYDAEKKAKIEIIGDDDVWVFVHGKLAIDIGGIHTPVPGSLTLDSAAATKFNLDNGRVYEIAVFQAERQTTASTLAITLPGFNSAPSQCRPL